MDRQPGIMPRDRTLAIERQTQETQQCDVLYRGNLLDVLVGGSEGNYPQFLGELGEGGVCHHGHVAKKLMDAVPGDSQSQQLA